MFKRGFFIPRIYVLGALCLAVTSVAQVASPPKEFWDYMEEFGDQNGNLLDPLEYDLIADLKSDGSLVVEDRHDDQRNPPTEKPTEKPINTFNNRNTDMNIKQQSSSQRSTASMRGAQQ